MEDYAYFRFYVAEWDNGIISDQSEHIEWAFFMICKMYWQRGGIISREAIKKRYQSITDDDINLLISINCIKVTDHASISFLDRQLGDCLLMSKKNSENALKRWEEERLKKLKKQNKNAPALPPHNEAVKPRHTGPHSDSNAQEQNRTDGTERRITTVGSSNSTSANNGSGTPMPATVGPLWGLLAVKVGLKADDIRVWELGAKEFGIIENHRFKKKIERELLEVTPAQTIFDDVKVSLQTAIKKIELENEPEELP